jgi:hypothetical protein
MTSEKCQFRPSTSSLGALIFDARVTNFERPCPNQYSRREP